MGVELQKIGGAYLSRAARRVFSSEKGSSGAKVVSDWRLATLALVEDWLRARESSLTASGSKWSTLTREADDLGMSLGRSAMEIDTDAGEWKAG